MKIVNISAYEFKMVANFLRKSQNKIECTGQTYIVGTHIIGLEQPYRLHPLTILAGMKIVKISGFKSNMAGPRPPPSPKPRLDTR